MAIATSTIKDAIRNHKAGTSSVSFIVGNTTIDLNRYDKDRIEFNGDELNLYNKKLTEFYKETKTIIDLTQVVFLSESKL